MKLRSLTRTVLPLLGLVSCSSGTIITDADAERYVESSVRKTFEDDSRFSKATIEFATYNADGETRQSYSWDKEAHYLSWVSSSSSYVYTTNSGVLSSRVGTTNITRAYYYLNEDGVPACYDSERSEPYSQITMRSLTETINKLVLEWMDGIRGLLDNLHQAILSSIDIEENDPDSYAMTRQYSKAGGDGIHISLSGDRTISVDYLGYASWRTDSALYQATFHDHLVSEVVQRSESFYSPNNKTSYKPTILSQLENEPKTTALLTGSFRWGVCRPVIPTVKK